MNVSCGKKMEEREREDNSGEGVKGPVPRGQGEAASRAPIGQSATQVQAGHRRRLHKTHRHHSRPGGTCSVADRRGSLRLPAPEYPGGQDGSLCAAAAKQSGMKDAHSRPCAPDGV